MPQLTALQTAQLLILRNFWRGQDSPWKDAELTGEEIAQHWDDNWDDIENVGGHHEVRYHGVGVSMPTRIHFSWERNYDVGVMVINLDDDRGLAFNYVTGGGKHGDPDSYPWWKEAWFVKCTGTRTEITYTYEDIPEVKDEQPPAS